MRVRVGGLQATPKYQVDLGGTCGFPLTPTLSLSWPAGGRDLAAIVWKDAVNRCGVWGGRGLHRSYNQLSLQDH